ncbi:MAG TPA: response regulator [Streptosporangiaceae bacterium]
MGGRARILLVDDRRENLIALDAILSSISGTLLVPVRSGEQALTELAGEDYAVVLLDVMMPGLDGFETADRIRNGERNKDVPIIFLTAATARPDATFRGYTIGAVDYLAKPFDPWVLAAKVSVFVDLYLRNADQAERLYRRVADVEETAAHLSGIPSVAEDPETGDTLAELVRRVGKLRDVLDDMTGPVDHHDVAADDAPPGPVDKPPGNAHGRAEAAS